MIAILDYKAGNQTSVLRAFQTLGIDAIITDDNARLMTADGVIFPGVGAAAQAMDRLKSTGQDIMLQQIIDAKIPLLGVCLGCQILLESSEENDTETLGIFKGHCLKFKKDWFDGYDIDQKKEHIRIPHMGWNHINIIQNSPIIKGLNSGDSVYFVHSYYPEPTQIEELCIATTTYGKEFCSIYGRDGLWAIQFHPEKSGKVGLQILKNFNDYCVTTKK